MIKPAAAPCLAPHDCTFLLLSTAARRKLLGEHSDSHSVWVYIGRYCCRISRIRKKVYKLSNIRTESDTSGTFTRAT
jgi:hypothetical protein